MIIDRIENAARYAGVVKNLDKALAFIEQNPDLPLGRYEFEGGAVISSEGSSQPLSQKEFESHQNFADVMVILEGEETVSYRQCQELSLSKAYDPAADCAFYRGAGLDIVVTVPKGYFYAVMPGEGHKPGVHLETETSYKKYILKCDQRE